MKTNKDDKIAFHTFNVSLINETNWKSKLLSNNYYTGDNDNACFRLGSLLYINKMKHSIKVNPIQMILNIKMAFVANICHIPPIINNAIIEAVSCAVFSPKSNRSLNSGIGA